MIHPRARCSTSAEALPSCESSSDAGVSFKLTVLATVSILSLGAHAAAQTATIDTETSTPVTTSTADGGNPADIDITTDGSIEIEQTDGSAAITVDSDSSVNNDGTIQIDESDNSVGILIEADRSASITGAGNIYLYDNYERTDDDDDDDLDGPLAEGTNRTAILLQSGGTHTGNITLETGADVDVEGNQSYGIRLQSELDGDLAIDGSVAVIGDEARAIRAEQEITGDVLISGAIGARGENAQAIELEGDVGGALTFESLVTSSGFADTSITNYVAPTAIDDDTPAIEDRIDAEDLLDNAGTVAIRGSVAGGILINGNVDDFVSEEDSDDETKDTTEDFDENRSTGTISSIGSGTALLIAAEDSDLVIGSVVETVRDTLDDDEDDDLTETLATFNYDQGLINRGVISANGLNIGFDATALRIEGAADGSADVLITGGIANSGTIQAAAVDADAVAASFGTGAQIGELTNSGDIIAQTIAVTTETATALLVEAGASLTTLENDQGSIRANATGVSGSATAIRDLSGTLTSITNRGIIAASLSSDGTQTEETGEAVAIDLSGHDASTGATLVQQRATPIDDINDDDSIDNDDVVTPSILGDIRFGAGNDTFQLLAGSVTGDTDFSTGDADFNITNSTYSGDVQFSDGQHVFTASNATVSGALSFEDSVADITLQNGSVFSGSLSATASTLTLSAFDSDLSFDAGNRTALSSLLIMGESELTFNIDPTDTDGAVLSVAGTAALGSDVTITPVLESIARDPFSQVLVSANALTFDGTFNSDQITSIPFLYNIDLSQTDTELELFFELKTADELGFDDNQARAYGALTDVFVLDDDLGAAIATIDDGDHFHQVYDLLLPQRTNASQQFLATQWNAAFGALNDHLSLLQFANPDETGIWVQEYYYSLDEDTRDQTPGYNGDGYGFALGLDRSFGPIDRIGAMITYASGSFEEKTGGYNPISTSSTGLGLYAVESLGPLQLRLAGQISSVGFASNRNYDVDELIYQIEGDWSGISQSASIAAVSEFDLGWAYLRPEVSADWFATRQDGYTETGSASTDSLFAEVSDVDTDAFGVAANFVLGREVDLGGGIMRAEVNGGYRTLASSTPYSATVSFVGTEESFELMAPEGATEAALFGVSLTGDGGLISSKLGYDVKVTEEDISHVVGATIRLKF
ncbi:MAG: autotransporter outer membrane beta-barrel domain-containing protein [Hyphomonadaceae bacterium]|nr:autotransporter outer membrane beta-barrel domain-containing protein [Hyphomonadaceae bacterium]